MMKQLKNNSGFTLTEMMVATMVMVLLMIAATSTSITTQKVDRNSRIKAKLFSQGTQILTRIERGDLGRHGLMKARFLTIAFGAGGDQVTFNIDKNDTYTPDDTTDDTEMTFYYVDGDADPTTMEDNVVMMDPDTSILNDEYSVGNYVSNLDFTLNGTVVTVDLSVEETVQGQTYRVNFTRNIWPRN